MHAVEGGATRGAEAVRKWGKWYEQDKMSFSKSFHRKLCPAERGEREGEDGQHGDAGGGRGTAGDGGKGERGRGM